MHATRALIQTMAVLLLAGTILLGAGAIAHPMLPADPVAQLGAMAATAYWRAIHELMIVGSGLVIAGIWIRVYIDRSRLTAPLVLALATVAIGLAFNAWNIEFMAGTGTADATRFAAGDTSVISSFATSHTVALSPARLGNTLVAVGCLVLGWIEWRDPDRPVWIAGLAWLSSVCGIIGVTVFDPGSREALAAVALVTLWAAATAVLVIRSGGRAGAPAR
jgi:hypothetical protein